MTGMPHPEEAWIASDLRRRKADGLLRRLSLSSAGGAAGDETVLNLASNDYLGLARHPSVIRAACAAAETYGAGSGASRLLTGSLPCHEELETTLAHLKGTETALVFGSGYAANVGIVSSLVSSKDLVIADRLSHASLLDGARLSGAVLRRFRHNDPEHLAELLLEPEFGRRRLILTESVFSMDGDLAPLREIAALARDAGAMLLVDEAHATGLFGPGGAGRVRELGLERDVTLCMGTLSKALGSFGGFAACSIPMRDYLLNHARSFIFSTSLPPAAAGAALGAMQVIAEDPDMGKHALDKADRVRSRLRAGGCSTLQSESPILPVLTGSNDAALRISQSLRNRGIRVGAIRPPTVPPGTARLRLSISLAHPDTALDEAADRVIELLNEESAP